MVHGCAHAECLFETRIEPTPRMSPASAGGFVG